MMNAEERRRTWFDDDTGRTRMNEDTGVKSYRKAVERGLDNQQNINGNINNPISITSKLNKIQEETNNYNKKSKGRKLKHQLLYQLVPIQSTKPRKRIFYRIAPSSNGQLHP